MDEEERVGSRRAPIRIECSVPGHQDQHVIFKADGWKFKHLRLWENATSVEELALLLADRIESWHLLDEAGAEIPFRPAIAINGTDHPNPAVCDELAPEVNYWLVTSYRVAYREAGRPSPNA